MFTLKVLPLRKEATSRPRIWSWAWFGIPLETVTAVTFSLMYCFAATLAVDRQVTAWGDDWAQYIMHARALAEGRAYSDINYVWLIYAPYVGPPAYPPGTAFVLGTAFLFFGYGLEIARFAMIGCFGVFLLLLYLFLSSIGSRTIALVTLVIVALTPVFWHNAASIASENPYLVWIYLGLLLSALRERMGGWPGTVGFSVLLGIAIGLAYATRQAGIVLLLTILMFDIVRWRQLAARALPMLATFALVALWQQHFVADAATYDLITISRLGSGVVESIPRLLNDFRYYAYLSGHLDAMTGGFLLLFVAAGFSQALRPCVAALLDKEHPLSTRLVGAMRMVPIHAIFLVGNVLLLTLLPRGEAFEQGGRYLRPFVPLMLWHAVIAAGMLISASRRPRLAATALTLGITVLISGTYLRGSTAAVELPSPTSRPAQALFAAVRQIVPHDSIVAFAKPRVMALFSDRRCISWPSAADRPWGEVLAQQGVRYFAITNNFALAAPGRDGGAENKAKIQQLEERSRAAVIFRNKAFTLYRIADAF